MKSSKACHQCRGSKRKCSRPVPGEACISCQQRSQRCSYDLQSQSPHNRATVSGPKGTKEATLSPSTLAEGSDSISPVPPDLSWDTTVELVENYFRHVHGRPHSIFHPATVRAQLRDGTLGPGLLSAVCAIGARFSSLPDKKPVEARLTSIAKQLVKADIETVSVENIQACILLAFLSATNCETSSEALFIRTHRYHVHNAHSIATCA